MIWFIFFQVLLYVLIFLLVLKIAFVILFKEKTEKLIFTNLVKDIEVNNVFKKKQVITLYNLTNPVDSVDSYIINKENNKKELVIKFKINGEILTVLEFNKKGVVTKTHELKALGENSDIIKLKSSTKDINIINNKLEKLKGVNKLSKFIYFDMLLLLIFIFTASYYMSYFILGNLADNFFDGVGLIVTSVVSLVSVLLYYLINNLLTKKRGNN